VAASQRWRALRGGRGAEQSRALEQPLELEFAKNLEHSAAIRQKAHELADVRVGPELEIPTQCRQLSRGAGSVSVFGERALARGRQDRGVG